MSGWQVGDLALCIRSGEDTRSGCIYTVSRITRPGEVDRGCTNHSHSDILDFYEFNWPPNLGACCTRFVKVTPGTDIEGVEERRRIPVGEPA